MASTKLFVLGSFIAANSMRVHRFPEPGQSLEAFDYTFEAGGKGLNLAVAARRLGAEVDGIIAVGLDAMGDLAAPALARAGLPAEMVVRFDAPTGAGLGFVRDDGENCLAVYLGANRALTGADLGARAARIAAADLVLAQFEIGDAPIGEAFAIARRAGKRTLLNPSPVRPIDPALLADTSILVVNAGEARALGFVFGRDTGNIAGDAADMLERGPDLVVVTQGAEGATAFARGEAPLHQPIFPIAAIDTLGAGDAFTAGLAVALGEGRDLAEAMRQGAACGALVACKQGVFDALPARADLDAFLVE